MRIQNIVKYLCCLGILFLLGCSGDRAIVAAEESDTDADTETETDFENQYPSLFSAFSAKLDFDNLPSYNRDTQPNYVNQDNTAGNSITNSAALLGRILFYDKNLSSNNTTSCPSCHTQSHAFGSIDTVSAGANGITERHSMRLVNARFGQENNFFGMSGLPVWKLRRPNRFRTMRRWVLVDSMEPLDSMISY